MQGDKYDLKTCFKYGSSTVQFIFGDILRPVDGINKAALVSSDDNYLTMHSGVSGALRYRLGNSYIQELQAKCPVEAGSVLCTNLSSLKDYQNQPEKQLDSNIEYIFHAAVIDYDNSDSEVHEVVERAAANCLARAEDLGLKSILFPVMGAGGASEDQIHRCASAMFAAIKAYLAQERPVKDVIIVLRESSDDPQVNKARESRNKLILQAANLNFAVPYNPALAARQSRDIYSRSDLVDRLIHVLNDSIPGKRHVFIRGGPKSGKSALLDQFFLEAQTSDRVNGGKKFFAKDAFGRILENTSLSFVYRKLLISMSRYETDPVLRQKILDHYAVREVTCKEFLGFLSECYPDKEIIFLIDELPTLLSMDEGEELKQDDIRMFWGDLDKLDERVRFFYTIRDDQQYDELHKRLELFNQGIVSKIEEIWVPCISEQQRQGWVEEVFHRYIQPDGAVPFQIYDFFKAEAGVHPYLLSMVGYYLVDRIQRDRVLDQDSGFSMESRAYLARLLNKTRQAIEEPRRKFFTSLLEINAKQKINLYNLARATALEQESRSIISSLMAGDINAPGRLEQLQEEGAPRDQLEEGVLEVLRKRGYIIKGADQNWQLMSQPFATFVLETLSGKNRLEDQPTDVVISLLPGEANSIRTMFRSRGARILTAQKPLPPDFKAEFLNQYRQYIDCVVHGSVDTQNEVIFRNADEVGNLILTQFTTVGIKRYLQNPPDKCTVLFLVDETLQEIPWELMLEAAYVGEIPFLVGRSIVSMQPAQNTRPPVRGSSHVKALLIGDPTGDLEDAEYEIEYLEKIFKGDPRFIDPVVLLGKKDCGRMNILKELSSGKYGLVHYSGHSVYRGSQSAWQVGDGYLTTELLTNAIQMAPPAIIFSSSCSSARSEGVHSPVYENQAFDLPGAFLQAGVETYIGSLWNVESNAAREYVEFFYSAFLDGRHNLGECVRRAKWELKQVPDKSHNDWLAFILYGDPHIYPHDLFPLFKLNPLFKSKHST
jgi:O-acetyl-ADP-ribose deacetylase (regulator of RNase III)